MALIYISKKGAHEIAWPLPTMAVDGDAEGDSAGLRVLLPLSVML